MPPPRPQIPLPYRILLLYFEPLLALNGAVMAHFFPSRFLLTMSPSATAATYSPQTQVIYDQLAATYVLFALVEAVVLRVTSELSVWKAVVFGALVCDVIHLYGSCASMGVEVFVRPGLWRADDWVNLTLLYGPAVMRLGLLFEVGFGRGKTGKEP
ncbi:hypothetical protein FGG08_006103 [Glutinoglossum americanum]|uniref:DUF7704 domain-containing protein n=1 Tax=Glutinoglossum americanum TaxID=1670608 RepID=A0A9P8I5X4_9PEZI|nr:hypothetical protein FGG08_006103 [Glutinoglossum americanum]